MNRRIRSPLARVIAAGNPPRLLILAAIVVALFDVAATLAFPVLTRDLIDHLGTTGTGAALTSPQLVLLVCVLVGGALCGAASAYMLARAGLSILHRTQRRLFESVADRPVAFFDGQESGALVSRITGDTRVIAQLLTNGISGLVTGSLLLVGSVVVLALLDGPLTAMIFAIVIGTFVLMVPMVMRLAAINKAINGHTADVGAALTRVFSGIRLVKAFTAEPMERDRIAAHLAHGELAGRRLAKVQATLSPANGLAITAALILLFTYGTARVAAGTLSAGTLTAFILYIFNIIAPLIHLSRFISQYRMAQGAAEPLADLLQAPTPSRAVATPVRWSSTDAGDLVLEDVRFGYGDDPVLTVDRLVIPAGARTAIVGASGSGKSTLLALLERFYAPQHGRILCGGVDISQIDLTVWRQAIGYVPQTPTLVSGTIRDNIVYGAHDIDEPRLLAAAAAANCLEFVDRLPGGLDAAVGENGVLLSGGQRQRIALARLFYRDPVILLLDEATASLDEANGQLVMQSFQRLMEGRTTVIVTHQLGMLRDLDRLYTVVGGRLVETDLGATRPVVRETLAAAS
ncbi:ABC transporter ATP-binding protein [Sphingomonas sp. Leaf33]|uniref:ABC transporter ATP-binding protein n=1 Tax=Sphingomonas sp. Leaf33 TaxID=1736215 RepID=UPI000A4D8B0E|nr:ABC transporter ATP-binding protein [Sphingomonas sp. Leaf33]